MRLFQETDGAPIAVPQGVSLVTVNGPTYKFTSQSQIWRPLWVHAQWEMVSTDAATNTIMMPEGWVSIVLNPNKGGDKHIRCPIRCKTDIAIGGFDLAGFGVSVTNPPGGPPAFSTLSFDTDDVNLRGDDLQTLGGIQFVQGASSDFSLQIKFNYIWFTVGGGFVAKHRSDIMVDFSDYSESAVIYK